MYDRAKIMSVLLSNSTFTLTRGNQCLRPRPYGRLFKPFSHSCL